MPPTPKQAFVQWCFDQRGRPVLWSAKGEWYVDPKGTLIKLPPGVLAFDCSGLVSAGLKAVLGKELAADHNAQKYWNEAEPFLVVKPEPGDLGFYGVDPAHVVHIVIALAGGRILSADGASSSIVTLTDALKNPLCRVADHRGIDYRHDVPFLGWRRNIYFPEPVTAAS